MEAEEIKGPAVRIPIPPSGNHMYGQRVVKRKDGPGHMVFKYPMPEYLDWLDAALPAIREAFRGFEPPVIMVVQLFGGRGFIESRDWDNLQKCLGDACQFREFTDPRIKGKIKTRFYGAGVLPNDNVSRLVGWRTRYYTREEHLSLTKRPITSSAVSEIEAACLLQIVKPAVILPFEIAPKLFDE